MAKHDAHNPHKNKHIPKILTRWKQSDVRSGKFRFMSRAKIANYFLIISCIFFLVAVQASFPLHSEMSLRRHNVVIPSQKCLLLETRDPYTVV